MQWNEFWNLKLCFLAFVVIVSVNVHILHVCGWGQQKIMFSFSWPNSQCKEVFFIARFEKGYKSGF